MYYCRCLMGVKLLALKNKVIKIIVTAFCIITVLASCGTSAEVKKSKALEAVSFPVKPYEEKLYDSSIIYKKEKWATLNTHDPSIFKDGDTYYVVSTDASNGNIAAPGTQMRKSKDLINWEYVGPVFEGIPKAAREWTGAVGLWAPELTKIGNNYYLYYCASTFGSNKSFIGVAKSKSMEGPWEELGEVIKTSKSDKLNAIDPNLVYDQNGDLWMSYGSFWSGIYILKIDKNTGKPLEKGFGKHIAGRNSSVSGAIEGPYITYNSEQKKYYLFVSYDSLSKDYNVRVGRSDSIDGPYVDSNGVDMTDTLEIPFQVGNKVMGGYKFGESDGWIAPGHNSILRDGDDFYIVHHARGDKDSVWFYMHVRKILWSQDGWPMVSPERYAGEKKQPLSKDVIPGTWEAVVLVKYDNLQLQSEPLKLLKDGKIDDGSKKSTWEFSGENILTLNLYDDKNEVVVTYDCKVIPAWDWELNKETIVFTGIDKTGVAIWGKMS